MNLVYEIEAISKGTNTQIIVKNLLLPTKNNHSIYGVGIMNQKIIMPVRLSKRSQTLLVSLFVSMAFAATNMFAAIINLEASIDGAQANAGIGTMSAATGSATITLDDQTNLLSWDISWSGLEGNVTNAHFHGPAAPGVSAGVQVPVDFNTNPAIGSAVITDDQETDLLAGIWYINIHSDRDEVTLGGEIRGQVLQVQGEPIPEPGTLALTVLGGSSPLVLLEGKN